MLELLPGILLLKLDFNRGCTEENVQKKKRVVEEEEERGRG